MMDGTEKKAGDTIRARRTARKMTLGELGSAAGIDVSQLSKLERGLCRTSVETYDRIAEALGWSPAEFWRKATKAPHRAA
jgi:transcriptional regulator with XRE-family HTH domain